MRVFQTGLTGLALALLIPSPAAAWHNQGHMLVARVAWQQLTDKERAKGTKILKAHPHYDIYLAADRPKDLPEPEWVFVRAPTWSDYQSAAEAVAARRMVLAGYRLADQLKLVLQPGK